MTQKTASASLHPSPAAIVSVPLAVWGTWKLVQLNVPMHPPVATNKCGKALSTRLFDRASTPLFLAYAGAGLGYILPMTLLPLLANVELQPGHWLQDGSWLLVALAFGLVFLFFVPRPDEWHSCAARGFPVKRSLLVAVD
jgi:hypothetical protein